MRRATTLIVICLCLAFAASCAKKMPPELTAQEYFDSGMRYYKMENYSMALSEFEMAVSKSPSFVEAQYYLGLTAWKLNMFDRARRAFIDTLNLNPSHVKARESLGIMLYVNYNDFVEAKRHLEAARNLNSINPEVYYCLGKIYVAEGRCPEALEVFQKGIMVDSTFLPLKTELENAKRACGKGSGPKAPPVIYEKKFRGGGKAIDPSDF